ncbi:hypothetical protein NUU61_006703 [Penicillium alfredii]|uniref:non-specific serine/threonine protein kinase n=1 Tax=Penicillium alfredii TaxID=1506179 RepID=A0A9W9F1E5_9EURO|nr:uncharacterized protein NUU61_006703 [Penicillium alfredii]KAJ5091833.1 hypothetical protein NUU61_006703 [Penicillium alfredii]
MAIRRALSPPIRFPNHSLRRNCVSEILEEERFENFRKGCYYPVETGQVFYSKYQVVGKLGFGVTCTAWLVLDLKSHTYATLKVYIRNEANQEEFQIYKHLSQGNPSHPGYAHVRTALDAFTIPHPGGCHHGLVQKPMWESFRDLLLRNLTHRFTEDLLKAGLMQVFLALDYLHTECKFVHTVTTFSRKYGNDPDGKGYSTRAHLAEVIGMLGAPPLDLLKRGKRCHEFSLKKIPQNSSLAQSEEFLDGQNKEMYLQFMRGMLQWRPEDRKTARELLDDP